MPLPCSINVIIVIIYLFLTAIGLTPGGSSTVHLHTNNTQNTENGTYITNKMKENNWELRAVLGLCELYPGVCLTTE
jgi:uncharacterized protein YceK